jgi:hypothetical protein
MTDPALNKRFQAVVAAADAGDIRGILNLASGVPGYVMWNAERQAVQIKACSQAALIASLPVRDPMMVAMAQKLPSVQLVLSVATPPHLPGR